MRWAASLFALGLMMALFHRVTAGSALEARATLALGFLLLVAHIGGALAQRVRVPRLTAYLLIGFAVGPSWLGLVRRDEVDALRLVADAALALIAFAAGTELTLEGLRREGRPLTRAAAGAIAFPFAAVTLVALSVTPWFPITKHQPFGDGASVALVLGALAATSSPAVTMATIGDLGARGPLARALPGVTGVQAVAVAFLFSLVLAVCGALASPGALDRGVAGAALARVAGSLAAGAALAFALGRFLRLARRDAALLVAAAAFLIAVLARVPGLDPVIVALAAGLAVGRFAPEQRERVRAELQRGARITYVAFFAVVGAGVRAGALADLWPWAVLLVGLRVLSLRYGLLWAGRGAGVTQAMAREGWAGLISQGGVALGLAQLARRAFPEWGVSLEALLVAMIGVHEAVGPIALRRALVRAGELSEGAHDAEASVGGDGGGGARVAARGL